MSEVTITYDRGGNKTLEVNGAIGPSCLKEHAALEAKLGRVKDRTFKPEYHRQAVQKQKAVAK